MTIRHILPLILILLCAVQSVAQTPRRSKFLLCRIVSVESKLPETAVAVTEARQIMTLGCGKRGMFTRDVTDGWPATWMGKDIGDRVRGRLIGDYFYPLPH